MITNRPIVTVRLLERSLDEVVASARENGVTESAIADRLRERAAVLDPGGGSRGASGGGARLDSSGAGPADGRSTASRPDGGTT